MFIIKKKSFGTTTALRLYNTATDEYAEIVPACGGILNALVVKNGGHFFNVIDGFEDYQDFSHSNAQFFKSNILFPFPNRVRDGKFSFQGREHQLKINFPKENNAIHGLVYDHEFEIVSTEEGDNSAKTELAFQSDGFPGFPFKFLLKITYIFSERGLEMESQIKNNGEEEFPFGFGWHHYFKVGDTINNAMLNFPAEKLLEVDDQMIPDSNEKAYTDFKELKSIGTTNLDTCFYLGDQGTINIQLKDPEVKRRLTLNYESKDFPYLQVFTTAHRKSIAVEPMTCAPDVFNNKLGLRTLNPGDSYSCIFRILF